MGRNKGDPELENTTVCVRVLHKELENTFVDFFFLANNSHIMKIVNKIQIFQMSHK